MTVTPTDISSRLSEASQHRAQLRDRARVDTTTAYRLSNEVLEAIIKKQPLSAEQINILEQYRQVVEVDLLAPHRTSPLSPDHIHERRHRIESMRERVYAAFDVPYDT